MKIQTIVMVFILAMGNSLFPVIEGMPVPSCGRGMETAAPMHYGGMPNSYDREEFILYAMGQFTIGILFVAGMSYMLPIEDEVKERWTKEYAVVMSSLFVWWIAERVVRF